MNKYYIHMKPRGDDIDNIAAGSAGVTTVSSTLDPCNRLVFWQNGAEIGSLDWEQGYVKFEGAINESAHQLASVAGERFRNVTQTQAAEIAETRKLLANLIVLLNSEQFEDTRAQAALDYLHQHEFFENLIRGS